MSKLEIAEAKIVVAAQFFENVWGESNFVTKVVPLFIGLSSLGNAFAQSFAMPRVKQELAKEGVLPWSRLWASDWPFNSPTGAIFLHWIFTIIFILGSHTDDVYAFTTNVFVYSGNWIKCMRPCTFLDARLTPTTTLTFASSLPRCGSHLPQFCTIRRLGRAADHLPQLAHSHHLLDPRAAIRAGSALYREWFPRPRKILCLPDTRHQLVGHRHDILAHLGQVVTSLGLPHPARDCTDAGWE